MVYRYSCQHYLFCTIYLFFNKYLIFYRMFCYYPKYYFKFAVSVYNLKSLYIFEVKELDHWAVTHSHKDGCLQAHLLAVKVQSTSFSLRLLLRTLTYNLGCFPLDLEPSRSRSDYFLTFFCIRSFLKFGKAWDSPYLLSALPQKTKKNALLK